MTQWPPALSGSLRVRAMTGPPPPPMAATAAEHEEKGEKGEEKKKDEHICASQRSTRASSIFVAGDLLHPTPKRQERPWRRWSCFVPQPPGDRHQDVVETATRTSTSYPYLAAEQVMSTREKTTESLPDTSPLCRRAFVCVCVCVCERACCGRCSAAPVTVARSGTVSPSFGAQIQDVSHPDAQRRIKRRQRTFGVSLGAH